MMGCLPCASRCSLRGVAPRASGSQAPVRPLPVRWWAYLAHLVHQAMGPVITTTWPVPSWPSS